MTVQRCCGGPIEIDQPCIGGKERNKYARKRINKDAGAQRENQNDCIPRQGPSTSVRRGRQRLCRTCCAVSPLGSKSMPMNKGVFRARSRTAAFGGNRNRGTADELIVTPYG